MKKILSSLLLVLIACSLATLWVGTRSLAGVSCSVPFTFINGQTADATQVNANFNSILLCLSNNTAASGANSDITALLGLTTPIQPSSGGTSDYIGSSVTNTSSSLTVGTTNPTNWTLTAGYKVKFVSSGNISGPGAITLNVGSSGALNFYRQTPEGPAPMVGGEITNGQIVEAIYDGTEYQMVSAPALGHAPGEVFDYAGATGCPVGSLETNTASANQTTYATLFGVLGTTWGAAAGGNFTIPDLRGRAVYGRDSGGSNRITVAGGNFSGATVGNTGGQQNQTLTSTGQLPPYTPAGTVSTTPIVNWTSAAPTGGTSTFQLSSQSTGTGDVGGLSVPATFTGTPVGSSNPFATLSNAAIVVKCIKG
jgi:microcystin-dependent protein